MFDFTMPTDALRSYAAARGLGYETTGLLPPISTVLERGLGVGEKRAMVVTRETAHGYSARGGLKRYPERATWNLCEGTLPGGLTGALGHHQHLELRSNGPDSGDSWHVVTDTVVVTRLPERSRALCELKVSPGATGDTATLRGTHSFDVNPAEDRATLDAVASPATLTALGADTRVELIDGVLCVWAIGIVEDATALDALCAVAAGIADGIRATVARHGDLDPAVLLPAPPDTPRQRWLDDAVAMVDWTVPPASVADARAAYEPLVAGRAAGSGRRVGAVVLLVGLLACAVWFGASYFTFKYVWDDELYGVAFASVTTLIGLWRVVRHAFESGEEVRSGEVHAQAGPWSLEAFARGYARTRGLTMEDPDTFRHQLSSPVGGKALRVMGGDLGGVRGHVALWRDWVQDAHWLIAVVPGGETDARAPYQASRAGGALVVGRQVTEAQRTATGLDALIAEALRLASPLAVAS